MRITLQPICSFGLAPIAVSVVGDTITVNGAEYDLSPLPEGGGIASAVVGPCFTGELFRKDGDIHLSLLFPYVHGLSPEVTFPDVIVVDADGPVVLPEDTPPADAVAQAQNEELP